MDDIDTIHQFNDIIYHNIFTGKNFLLSHGKYWEVICVQVKAWATQFDQEQDMFLVRLGEGQATEMTT